MTTCAYPPSALLSDGGRGAVGIGLAAWPLTTLSLSVPLAILLAACLALFAVLALQAALRHLTRVEVTADGLRLSGPRARTLYWCNLSRMRIAYYSTRRERDCGWLTLTLGDGRGRITVDSRLSDFHRVAEASLAAARRNGLALDAATIANLAALGLPVPPPGQRQ